MPGRQIYRGAQNSIVWLHPTDWETDSWLKSILRLPWPHEITQDPEILWKGSRRSSSGGHRISSWHWSVSCSLMICQSAISDYEIRRILIQGLIERLMVDTLSPFHRNTLQIRRENDTTTWMDWCICYSPPALPRSRRVLYEKRTQTNRFMNSLLH